MFCRAFDVADPFKPQVAAQIPVDELAARASSATRRAFTLVYDGPTPGAGRYEPIPSCRRARDRLKRFPRTRNTLTGTRGARFRLRDAPPCAGRQAR
jgi:hypothetical protein